MNNTAQPARAGAPPAVELLDSPSSSPSPAVKTLRCTLEVADLINFNPQRTVDKLKAAGFAFASEACPIKLAGDSQMLPNRDGSVTFTQAVPLNA